MKKHLLYIILISCIHLIKAQKITQKDILRSGKYYYSVAYDKDTLQARQTALRGLMNKIAEDKKVESSTGKSGKIFLDNVHYFTLPLIEQYKVIAYIDKNDVRQDKQLSMTEIVVNEEKNNNNEIIDKKEKKTITKDSIKTGEKKIIEQKDKTPDDKEINKPDRLNEKLVINKSPVIVDLVKTGTAHNLLKKLQKYKNEGKIQVVTNVKKYSKIYGDKDFYKIILDKKDKSIRAFIDKNSHTDLKTGRIINDEEINQNLQLWLKTL